MSEELPTTFDFDASAREYDRWYETPEGAIYDRLEKSAIARFLPEKARGMRLLELGCGTGHWTRFFTEHGFIVTGVDYSRSMIDAARDKGIHNASFAVADAHALPFEDGQFDVSAAITVLEFVRKPEVAVKEMVRCVRREGGLILIGVLNALAAINRHRTAAQQQPYVAGRFFSPRELVRMLVPHGRARVVSAAYVPRTVRLLRLAPLTDRVAGWLHLPFGALVVGSVEL
jgi:ubiquinone/menaquinone biosynthesis C-methylase UbiE